MSAGKGRKLKTFMVHKSFATKSSQYIQSALKNEWKEGIFMDQSRAPIMEALTTDYPHGEAR